MLRRFHEFGGYDNNNVLIPPQYRHPATIRFLSAREQLFIPPVELQLGLHKRRLSYDFSFYVGRTGHIPKNFRSAALSTATQPW
jgi:hypothetical protein